MTYEEMLRKLNTAGAWFTGVFLGEFVCTYNTWHDEYDGKVKFIQQFHENYGKNLFYSEESTKTKCYAVMAIVEHHMVLDAIEHIINCNEKKVEQDAIENATALLDKICKDEIILP